MHVASIGSVTLENLSSRKPFKSLVCTTLLTVSWDFPF